MGWYEPPEHAEQAEAPVVADTVPAAHGVGAVEPMAHELPVGHSEHSLADDKPSNAD